MGQEGTVKSSAAGCPGCFDDVRDVLTTSSAHPAWECAGQSVDYKVCCFVLYVLVTGCAWRLVPQDLAPWGAAYRWFRAWTRDGVWAQVPDVLWERSAREPGPAAVGAARRLPHRQAGARPQTASANDL